MKESKPAVKFEDFKKEINKAYGPKTVGLASEIEALETVKLPTGIFSLDVLLGGGIPVGRTTQLFGDPSGGKTTLCLKIVAEAQKTCRTCLKKEHPKKEDHPFEPMKCLWVELESTFDKSWASKMGVDLTTLEFAQPESAEQAGNILEMFLQSTDGDLVVVDSLAHMTPQEELTNPLENQLVGVMARVLNKMFRAETMIMNRRKKSGHGPTVVMVNQVREKVGVLYGNPETRPGGKGQLFASSVEIRLSPGKPYYEGANGPVQKNPGEGALPIFVEINFAVRKSKIGVPRGEGTFKLQLRDFDGRKAGQTNEEEQVFAYAKRFQLIENPAKGKWTCLGIEESTEDKLLDKIMQTEGMFADLRTKTFERAVQWI
jgi:recombination protein RecA